MKIGIPAETYPGEARVAATPETVKKLGGAGHAFLVQAGAGAGASIPDAEYEAAGATILPTAAEVYGQAEMVLKVRAPQGAEVPLLRNGQVLVGVLNRFDTAGLEAIAKQGATAFALEAAPRITRAQSMDVLSSQANIAGYKAVVTAADHYGRMFPMMMTAAGTIKAARVVVMGVGVAGLQAIATANIAGYKAVVTAADHYGRMFPMMMTAAGTIKAARVVIMGVGVAGLQAIATAKRLGAVVEATDVRPETKEQVESLGAKFVEVPLTDAEKELAKGAGGYAREMGDDYRRRQAELVAERIRQANIVITTALIPGRPAPVLVTEDMVKSMKPGSVIVDMAAEQGGNCPLTERDQVVVKHGVTLIGHTNFPSMVAADSSALYARNVLDFLKLVIAKDGTLAFDRADEIIAACLMAEGGQVVKKG